jgi:stage V sporulation protein G
MKITELKVRLWHDQRLQALVTVVFDDCFVVRNIKVIEGREGKLFVAMPSRRLPDGTYVDIAHPITSDFRGYIEKVVLGAYDEELRAYESDPEAYRGRHGRPAGEDAEPLGDFAR